MYLKRSENKTVWLPQVVWSLAIVFSFAPQVKCLRNVVFFFLVSNIFKRHERLLKHL